MASPGCTPARPTAALALLPGPCVSLCRQVLWVPTGGWLPHISTLHRCCSAAGTPLRAGGSSDLGWPGAQGLGALTPRRPRESPGSRGSQPGSSFSRHFSHHDLPGAASRTGATWCREMDRQVGGALLTLCPSPHHMRWPRDLKNPHDLALSRKSWVGLFP